MQEADYPRGHFVGPHDALGPVQRLLCKLFHISLAGRVVEDGVFMRMVCFCLCWSANVLSRQLIRRTCSSLSINRVLYSRMSGLVVCRLLLMICLSTQYSPATRVSNPTACEERPASNQRNLHQ